MAADLLVAVTERGKFRTMPTALLMREQISDANVALASLFFDRVNLVVPSRAERRTGGAHTRTPSQLVRGLEAQGIVSVQILEPELVEVIGARLVEPITELYEQLRERYAFDGDSWPKTGGRVYTIADPWYPRALETLLHRQGLAFSKTNRYREYSYLRVPSPIGRIYFSALVENLAFRSGSSPTGNQDHWILGADSWSGQEIREALLLMLQRSTELKPARAETFSSTATGIYGSLAVRMAIPRRPESLSPEFIGKFRDEQRGHLTALQDYLSRACGPDGELSKNSGSFADVNGLRELLEIDYERHLAPAVLELERALRASRVDFLWNTLSLKAALPPSVAAALTMAFTQGPVVTGLSFGGGLVLGAAETWRKHLQARENIKKDSPVHYLLSLRKVGFQELKRS